MTAESSKGNHRSGDGRQFQGKASLTLSRKIYSLHCHFILFYF
jgi:hypothetical protein